MIQIVGLGLDWEDLTIRASCALLSGKKVLLRTDQHPITEFLNEQAIQYQTLDHLYEQSEDYEELCNAIGQAVVQADPCVYGVPGGAGLFDTSVQAVVKAANEKQIEVQILPGVGLCETAAATAMNFSGAVCLAAIDFRPAYANPRLPLILVELHGRALACELKLALLDVYPPSFPLTFSGETIALEDLDRQANYDHLTSITLPPLSLEDAESYDLTHLEEVVTRLRAPDGCPWDREQTHESLRLDMLEETYETMDAIEQNDMDMLCDELGDVLLHVAMQAEIAKEHSEFNLHDVTTAICRKMISRHPHVFGSVQLSSCAEVLENWNEIKKDEKSLHSNAEIMRDVPRSFPALLRAEKVQKKARNFGFDFDSLEQAMQKVVEEVGEVQQAKEDELPEELGDLLFATVNACRFARVSPEIALHASVQKFIARVDAMEKLATEQGLDLKCMSLEEMDILWVQVKSK